jgi:dihydroflavonol-4-reductase
MRIDKPVLVTGATGFLGHTLCPYLVNCGYRLRALVRPSSDWQYLRDQDVELAWGDVRDAEAVRSAMAECGAVVHAAGKFRFWGQQQDFFSTNLEGTRNMLEAAHRIGVERFIYISTVAVIGAPRSDVVMDETYPPTPWDDYQRSKWAAERLTLRYHRAYGLPALVLRPGAFYGPGGHYAFNRLFFEDPMLGIPVQVHHGRHVIFPVFVRDVAQAVDLALQRGQAGEIYHISGPNITHREANEIIDRALGYHIHRFNVPAWAMLALARVWTAFSHFSRREPYYPINLALYVFYDWQVSCQKAQQELGFVPTPFEDGVRETVAWYHEAGIEPTSWWRRLITRWTRRPL